MRLFCLLSLFVFVFACANLVCVDFDNVVYG